jgi:hypothetical protein
MQSEIEKLREELSNKVDCDDFDNFRQSMSGATGVPVEPIKSSRDTNALKDLTRRLETLEN